MTDHHDFADHFGDDHHDPLPFDDHQVDDHVPWDDHQVEVPGHEDVPFDDHHVEYAGEDHPAAELPTPEADTTPDLPEAELSDSVFPPAVDVGELPEPVDGFPWIDTGSLGLADIQAALHETGTTDPVQPAELAEYAGTDLPPGTDPWATLAESDDPATAALAKWWSQQN
ncbi:hypothetical protein [Paractinoplanes toevensis]|uniref:Uncharacterized protein n=1 Tax=Paractinoplanes toevensis TaxID=571911 RepID=A0A919TGW3_9ACTN|nr:hypothetical protein [Actinoplanes toevensis]GIM94932.1 hypothetical protein Ato02nite_067250 [Actinoplanes toevensis]